MEGRNDRTKTVRGASKSICATLARLILNGDQKLGRSALTGVRRKRVGSE